MGTPPDEDGSADLRHVIAAPGDVEAAYADIEELSRAVGFEPNTPWTKGWADLWRGTNLIIVSDDKSALDN